MRAGEMLDVRWWFGEADGVAPGLLYPSPNDSLRLLGRFPLASTTTTANLRPSPQRAVVYHTSRRAAVLRSRCLAEREGRMRTAAGRIEQEIHWTCHGEFD